jgi:hypothetical protein
MAEVERVCEFAMGEILVGRAIGTPRAKTI